MKRVLVVTDKPYLGQKIKLALSDKCAVEVLGSADADYDICLWDIDYSDAPKNEKIITISYSSPADLALPCTFESLNTLIEDNSAALIALDGRICRIRGERIKLTELEASLLSCLMSAEGEFVGREEILSRVWSGDADYGIVNVYIHYLREKIEQGEKIILSSRKQGYCIDKKYLGGGKNA
ncbi:MAG: winged helix-turn-helix transcriptional regulator [Clostridia bacterium]|nr:winged helix-turn-helix transcriptional regulator [Clostridia bacterium]